MKPVDVIYPHVLYERLAVYEEAARNHPVSRVAAGMIALCEELRKDFALTPGAKTTIVRDE